MGRGAESRTHQFVNVYTYIMNKQIDLDLDLYSCVPVSSDLPGRSRSSSIGSHRDMVTALSLIGNKNVVPILLSASRDGCIKAWR